MGEGVAKIHAEVFDVRKEMGEGRAADEMKELIKLCYRTCRDSGGSLIAPLGNFHNNKGTPEEQGRETQSFCLLGRVRSCLRRLCQVFYKPDSSEPADMRAQNQRELRFLRFGFKSIDSGFVNESKELLYRGSHSMYVGTSCFTQSTRTVKTDEV